MMRQELIEAYAPIWDMKIARSTCVVPERPLLITVEEERDLTNIALGIWRTVENVTETAGYSQLEPYRGVANAATAFPEGLTMPPAIRADLVKTGEGFKVVEIDPITAISLGETVLLADIWRQAGYKVIEPPIKQIANAAENKRASEISVTVPRAKEDYTKELRYLAESLRLLGIDVLADNSRSALPLSAFMEDPVSARYVNRQGLGTKLNPLWGPLVRLTAKDFLLDAEEMVDARLKRVLPRTARAGDALAAFMPDERVVCKPVKGTGSRGLTVTAAANTLGLKGYIVQELLQVKTDQFGSDELLSQEWASRISIYAGRTGVVGAQVTARVREGEFTNAHGQADAIQTTLAVVNDK